ncbi:hypothetical protein FM076_31295 [Streptomyces albus subsp. chlorinus]|uniref:hypothetical protein n=1 Tax=Streptomyces albus TaxID=1888 RepID=UPI001570F98B|nr:hypothetical protein [Streptomyces albus]NSC25397.1 hypothetical protein [Streptomyces albus subsp. chlorinus]
MNAQVWTSIAVLVWMVVAGFLRPPGGILSWPMYTRRSAFLVEVALDTGQAARPVDVYRVIPSGDYSMTLTDFELLLEFLQEPDRTVSGSGTVLHEGGATDIRIEAGRVAVPGAE